MLVISVHNSQTTLNKVLIKGDLRRFETSPLKCKISAIWNARKPGGT